MKVHKRQNYTNRKQNSGYLPLREQRWTVNGHKGTFWCDVSVQVLGYTDSCTTV